MASSIQITRDQCPLAFDLHNNDNDNDDGVFTYENGDLILYLFVDEGPCMGEDPPIAFSDECAMDQFDRPVAVSYILY